MKCLYCDTRMGCVQTRQAASATVRVLRCDDCGTRVRTREVIQKVLKNSAKYGSVQKLV